ncbi:MAG: transposase [Candidatus Tagabacteria bacterium]
MPIKRPQLVNNEIYHIIARGAGDSVTFRNDKDYYRAISSFYEFNTSDPIEIKIQKERHKTQKYGEPFSDTRKLLVEILAFCLMPNHIHLLLRQIVDGGISLFMRKFGAGYVGFFNKKYERKGPLFAKFRAVHIQSDEQLKIIFSYIHTNPVSLIEPHWKEKGIKDFVKTNKFLENYQWSSYLDYIGKKNFPSVIKRQMLSKIMGGEKECREFVQDWLKYKEIAKETKEFSLE